MAGGGELERVLASIFPEQAQVDAGGSLGDIDPLQAANNAQVPGLTYQGGWQPQRTGAAGQVARAYSDWVDGIYGGVDRSKCAPWMTPECLDVMSRLLEQTFRNFQLVSRLPSHISPPFPAKCIDCFDGPVTLPGNSDYSTADFVKVCCFQMPPGLWRGVIQDFGHALEDLLAWADVEWRVTLNGKIVEPYDSIKTQIWSMRLHSKSCRIHLLPQDTICLEARSLSATPHLAWARVYGWYYPVRSESGGMEIRATLVD